MDWKEVAGKITKVAPVLGSILGGPAGAAAGGVISLIGSLFGLSEAETTPDMISQIITQDPQSLLKFKELEMTHKIKLEELLIEREKVKIEEDQMYLQDIQDARRRQVDVEKATGKKDVNLYVLAWTYIGGYFVTTIMMTFLAFTNNVPIAMPNYMVFLLGNLFGTLTAGVMAIVQYFFGSSRGSGEKTAIMVDQFKNALKNGEGKLPKTPL